MLEYRVKAAFVFNFVRFARWSGPRALANRPFVIGVYEIDPFSSVLEKTTRGKTVAGRSIEIIRAEDQHDAGDCDVLFIADSEQNALADILGLVRGRGVMTVGESKSFLDEGGMVNFIVEGERVGFEVNLDAVRAEGLDLSSQLLKVARDVRYRRKRPLA